jgi:hypothetical protein
MKLTIDLVPSSCWYKNVRSLLTPKQWKSISRQVSSASWEMCEICGKFGDKHSVECHEVWEYDDKNLIQKLVKLIALCPKCHMTKHIGYAELRGNYKEVLKHFMKINNLSKKESEKYIADAFTKWAERSSKNWKLDVSYLEKYGINMKEISWIL